jgi:hypothetical protein
MAKEITGLRPDVGYTLARVWRNIIPAIRCPNCILSLVADEANGVAKVHVVGLHIKFCPIHQDPNRVQTTT